MGKPASTYAAELPRLLETRTFFPFTFGRCLVASAKVINCSSGPIRLPVRLACFAASHMNASVTQYFSNSLSKNHLRAFCALFEPLWVRKEFARERQSFGRRSSRGTPGAAKTPMRRSLPIANQLLHIPDGGDP